MAVVSGVLKFAARVVFAASLIRSGAFVSVEGHTLGVVMGEVVKRTLEALTLSQYFMGRDAEHSDELDGEILGNAALLVKQVNGFLRDHGLTTVKVSSGWRPAAINQTTKGAAKHSLHLTGRAVDIADHSGVYAHLFATRPDLLKKWDLWMENPKHTRGWVHLDIGTRPDRPIRIFEP